MKRRAFVQGILSTTSAVAFAGLTGCHSDHKDEVNDLPPLPQSNADYAMGLSYATSGMLANIVIADKNTFASTSSQAANNSTLAATQMVDSLPEYFNLADATLMGEYGWPVKLPPIGSQGKLGSCTAWGVGYAAGTFLNALHNVSGTPNAKYMYVSPADLYAKLLKAQKYSCGSGTYIKYALDIMVRDGVRSLFNQPYSDQVCANPSYTADFFIDGYYRIEPNNLLAIKAALNNFLVLPFGMRVYKDFHTLKGSGIYQYASELSGSYVGGHCMALVGYDDKRQAFRVMNSWGTNWADQGFVWLSYQSFIQLVKEVFVPFNVEKQAINTLVKTPSATSGSVTVESSLISSWLDSQINQRFLLSTIKLNAPMRLTSYRILFVYPNSNYITLEERTVDCFIRSFKFSTLLADDTFLKNYLANKQGWFAIQLVGKSIYNESVNLMAYNNFG